MPATQTLTDRDYLTEFLKTQKQLTASYNYHAGECVNTELRAGLLQLLDDEHDIQSDIFNEMHARGWYPVKAAEKNELETVRTKYPS